MKHLAPVSLPRRSRSRSPRRLSLLGVASCALGAGSTVAESIPSSAQPAIIVSTTAEPVARGRFQPSWESLRQYRVPEWFRDAKFGIWAHWGAQCQPERGDWYARNMYSPGHTQYADHLDRYGHPAEAGFKDIILRWKAERWDPEKLLALYKRAGAEYFMALANHHDNFDNWDSKYQPWNSVRLGPGKDLIAGWAAAARRQGMKFGVSVHASRAWAWYEVAQGADRTGPRAGVPYDGRSTRADGKGKWWEGYDPQDLYAQDHVPSPDFANLDLYFKRWNWNNGVSIADWAYCEKFYNRTIDLIDRYRPDMIYFDDVALPLWPVSDAGLKIAAHFYNRQNQWHGSEEDGVLFAKVLEADQRQCMAWDIERGSSNEIEPHPWQTDTCLGNWHYDQAVLERHGYKSARTVVHMLIDIVSKNGNLLLNVPLKGDGSPDADELEILEGIAGWMAINREAIQGTRPWKIFGEGPQAASRAPLSGAGFNEDKGESYTAQDVRFTTKGDVLYAILMSAPTGPVSIASLGTAAKLLERPIAEVTLVGSGEKLRWSQGPEGLAIEPPTAWPNDLAVVFRVTPRS